MRWLILFYRRCVSPFTAPSCRFQPTCSEYAQEAVERYGNLRGSWLTLCRILRCHPLGPMGYDPVPDKFRWRATNAGQAMKSAQKISEEGSEN